MTVAAFAPAHDLDTMTDEDAITIVHDTMTRWHPDVVRAAERRTVTCVSCRRRCKPRDIVPARGVCDVCDLYWTVDDHHHAKEHAGAVEACRDCRRALDAVLAILTSGT